MTRRNRKVVCLECEFCHNEYDSNSTEGRRFSEIPRGREDNKMDICEECYDALKEYFVNVIKDEKEE